MQKPFTGRLPEQELSALSQFYLFSPPVIEIDVMIFRMILKVTIFPTLFYHFHALDFRFVCLTIMSERYNM